MPWYVTPQAIKPRLLVQSLLFVDDGNYREKATVEKRKRESLSHEMKMKNKRKPELRSPN